MKSILFKQVTNTIAENQEQFNTVHSQWNPEDMSINLCFELTEEEVAMLDMTKKLYYSQQIGHGRMSPMRLSVNKEDIIKPNRKVMQVPQIDTRTPEGKLLIAALAMLTTEVNVDKTPDEILLKINSLADEIESNKTN